MEPIIRPAVQADAEALVAMGAAFFAEAGHEGNTGTFDPESFNKTLGALASAGLLLAVEKDGELVGMAAADVAPAFWNHNVMLGREAFYYIIPTARKGLGRKLLAALETVSRNYGVTIFDAVAEPGTRSKALSRMYEMAGFHPAEQVYRKRLG